MLFGLEVNGLIYWNLYKKTEKIYNSAYIYILNPVF